MESQTVSVQVWYDILNEIVHKHVSASHCAFSSTSSVEEISTICERFAVSQDMFTFLQV